MKKFIKIDERANKELNKFSDEVQAKFLALFKVLQKEGYLKEPFAKRINQDLFEIRVKHKGQWRAIYAYLKEKTVLVLSAFHKKTQKTAIRELKKAKRRFEEYL